MITVLSIVSCTGCGDTKNAAQSDSPLNADFAQAMAEADSLHNNMQFRDAYDLYLKLLNSKEARDDSEKRLNVLNSLCNSSELSGHKAEQPKWLQQQLDLAKETGNSYYHAKALVSMGQNISEFVRNCRLDYACRLMVEQPEMPFTEVGSQSGYQRTTTFYHDFKDRKKRLTSDE